MSVRAILIVIVLAASGCEQPVPVDQVRISQVVATTAPASSQERATRRAYDGAPPVIPHPPLGADCITCHTSTGKAAPPLGFAPANPHLGTSMAGSVANCRQCHVFSHTTESFVSNPFAGLPQDLRRGDRAAPGAPPVIPHGVFLRENCNACHTGPSARPEIRCTHPERTNCVQCHVAQQEVLASWPLVTAVEQD